MPDPFAAVVAVAALVAHLQPSTTPIAGGVGLVACLLFNRRLVDGRLPALFAALAFAAASVLALLQIDARVPLMFAVVALAWTVARARPRRWVRVFAQLASVLAAAWGLGVLSPEVDAALTVWLGWATHAAAVLALGLGFDRDWPIKTPSTQPVTPKIIVLADPPLAPWRECPEIPIGSMGWRMGYGEGYLIELFDWMEAQSPVTLRAWLLDQRPVPDDWMDFAIKWFDQTASYEAYDAEEFDAFSDAEEATFEARRAAAIETLSASASVEGEGNDAPV